MKFHACPVLGFLFQFCVTKVIFFTGFQENYSSIKLWSKLWYSSYESTETVLDTWFFFFFFGGHWGQNESWSLEETLFVGSFFIGLMKSAKSCKFYSKPVPHKCSAPTDLCGWPQAGTIATVRTCLTVLFLQNVEHFVHTASPDPEVPLSAISLVISRVSFRCWLAQHASPSLVSWKCYCFCLCIIYPCSSF